MARLAASIMVTPQHRPTVHRRVAGSLLLLLAALWLTVAPVMAKNVLSGAVVSPRSGTTATVFAFSVHYAGKPATSVVAHVGTLTVALSQASGTTSNGTWRRSRRLPAGTRSVSFSAASVGNVADLPAGQVTVTATPAPTPRATPRPTPEPVATTRPSAQATRAPTAKPRRSPSASSSAGATGSGKPPSTPTAVGGATQPSASPGSAGSQSSDRSGPLIPAIVLGLLVILGVGGIALLTGRREAEERPSPEPTDPSELPPPGFVRRATTAGAAEAAGEPGPPRARATWELYSSLENQPLGSVDEPLPDEPMMAGGETEERDDLPEPSEARETDDNMTDGRAR